MADSCHNRSVFSSYCVSFAQFNQSLCRTGVSFQIKDRCVSNEWFKVFEMLEITCTRDSACAPTVGKDFMYHIQLLTPDEANSIRP